MKLKYISKIYQFIFLVLGLSITSCEKFVDIKQSTTQRLIESVADAQLILNNYAEMNQGYPADGELSADNYYLSQQGYSSLSNQSDRDLYIWSTRGIREGGGQWLSTYLVVYYSNLALETVDQYGANTDKSTSDNVRGQALFFRSNSFWQLAQIYCKPYDASTANSDLGIPLRLSSDINGKSVRGTLQQTYDRIITDLQEAIGLLPNSSIISSRPNKASAYALLARVYLSMDNYEQALFNANSALQINSQLLDYNTLSTTSNTPFSRFNTEVLFHSITVALEPLNPGNGTDNVCKIDSVLFATYDQNDLRKEIFFKENFDFHAGSYRFSGNYEPAAATLFNGLAVDELFLIRAECYARGGNITAAMADLNTLLRTRWRTGTYIDVEASTTDDALRIILLERRKELIMRGQRWTDLRRLNKDNRFSTTIRRIVNGSTYTLPPNDPRYTLLIPDVIIRNSGYTIEQNTR